MALNLPPVPTISIQHNNNPALRMPVSDHPLLATNLPGIGTVATWNIWCPGSPITPKAKTALGIQGRNAFRLDKSYHAQQMQKVAQHIVDCFQRGVQLLALQEVPKPGTSAFTALENALQQELQGQGCSHLINVGDLRDYFQATCRTQSGTSVMVNPQAFKVARTTPALAHKSGHRGALYTIEKQDTQQNFSLLNFHAPLVKNSPNGKLEVPLPIVNEIQSLTHKSQGAAIALGDANTANFAGRVTAKQNSNMSVSTTAANLQIGNSTVTTDPIDTIIAPPSNKVLVTTQHSQANAPSRRAISANSRNSSMPTPPPKASGGNRPMPTPPPKASGGNRPMPTPPPKAFGGNRPMPTPPPKASGGNRPMPTPPPKAFGGNRPMPTPPPKASGGNRPMPTPPPKAFGGNRPMPTPPPRVPTKPMSQNSATTAQNSVSARQLNNIKRPSQIRRPPTSTLSMNTRLPNMTRQRPRTQPSTANATPLPLGRHTINSVANMGAYYKVNYKSGASARIYKNGRLSNGDNSAALLAKSPLRENIFRVLSHFGITDVSATLAKTVDINSKRCKVSSIESVVENQTLAYYKINFSNNTAARLYPDGRLTNGGGTQELASTSQTRNNLQHILNAYKLTDYQSKPAPQPSNSRGPGQ